MGEKLNSALKEAPPDESTEWLNPGHSALGVNRIAENGRVELLMPDGVTPRQKFALIGFSSATRHLAPLADPEWAVVGMNQLQRHLVHGVPGPDGKAAVDAAGEPLTELRHGDLWFEIHKEWNTAVVPDTDHAWWLSEFGQPVYMTDPVDEIPTSVAFPTDRLIDKFGLDYYTSTVSYMLAWAIDHIDHLVAQRLEGMPRNGESAIDVVKLVESVYAEYTIGVFGIDLIVGEEYCVAPETQVLTADLRWVDAWTLKPGDEVVAFDEHADVQFGKRRTRRWRRSTVEAANHLKRPCYRIRLADGTTLVSSAEHRWLTASGKTKFKWTRTDKLVTPQHRHPTRIVKLLDKWGPPVHSWDAGYLAGAFDSEGWLVGRPRKSEHPGWHHSLGYSQRDNASSAVVEKALDDYGFEWSRSDNNGCGQYRIKGGRPEIIKFLGQIRPERLLAQFDPEKLGELHKIDAVAVESIEYIGEQTVVGLKTSTGTFVAEGFASHNSHQRPSAEFWLGQALARNIDVVIPEDSALLSQRYRYGYQVEPDDLLLESDFDKRKAQLEEVRRQHGERAAEMYGRLHELRNPPDDVDARIAELEKLHHKEAHAALKSIGALNEAEWWGQLRTLRERGGKVR